METSRGCSKKSFFVVMIKVTCYAKTSLSVQKQLHVSLFNVFKYYLNIFHTYLGIYYGPSPRVGGGVGTAIEGPSLAAVGHLGGGGGGGA